MGVSRPVISAGVVELEKLGFVEVHPRQGIFVSDYRRKGTLETLIAIMRYNGGAMRRNEVKSLLETRDALECLCVRLLVEKATDEELNSLAPILESIQSAKGNEEAAERVFHFQHEMAVISGNVLLPLMYYSFRPESVYLWSIFCKYSGIQLLYQIKLELYKALLNRDVEGAQKQINTLLSQAIDNLPIYGA